MPAAAVERDRLHAIAYLALWQLRDLDPAAEPPAFKATRLTLHERIGDEPEAVPTPPVDPERRHLNLVSR